MGGESPQSANTPTVGSSARKTAERTGRCLVFHSGREEFGIRMLNVRKVVSVQAITVVPQTPLRGKGVIDQRS